MTKFIIPSLLFLLSLSVVCAAQSSQSKDRVQAVIVPQELYLPTIVSQPDCPLKIEKALVLKQLDGRWKDLYQVRNRGTKPIDTFSLAIWNSNSTGSIISWPLANTTKALLSGEVAPSYVKDGSIEFVPLNEDLKKKLKLDREFQGVVFFMVVQIKFTDGTEYDARPTFKRLENHLQLFESIYMDRVAK